MDVLHKGWWDNNKYFINISVVRVTAVSLWPDYSITPTTCLSLKTYPRCPLQKVSFIEGRSNCPVPALSLHTSFNKTRGWWFCLSGSPWWSPFWNTAGLFQYGKFNVDLEISDSLQLKGTSALKSLWKSIHKLVDMFCLLFSLHENRTYRKDLWYNNCVPEECRGSICGLKGAG